MKTISDFHLHPKSRPFSSPPFHRPRRFSIDPSDVLPFGLEKQPDRNRRHRRSLHIGRDWTETREVKRKTRLRRETMRPPAPTLAGSELVFLFFEVLRETDREEFLEEARNRSFYSRRWLFVLFWFFFKSILSN